MRATFVPPLASTTYLPATTAGTAKAIRVTLTALVSNEEYERNIFRNGGRLEVWTDVPSGEGDKDVSAADQRGWRAVAFTECADDEESPAATTSFGGGEAHDQGVPILRLTPSSASQSLASPSESQELMPRASHTSRTFRATLLIPRVPARRYAFTYRVVFPSHTRWLGTVETNGSLEVCERDLGFEEEVPASGLDGWKERKWVAASEDVAGKEVIIGKLDVEAWTWKGWTVNEAGRITFFSVDQNQKQGGVTHASLIYLVPYSQQSSISARTENPLDSVVSPRPLVFSTSSSASASAPSSLLSISPEGNVVVSLKKQDVSANGDATKSGAKVYVTVERRTHDFASDDDNRALVDSVRHASANALAALETRSFNTRAKSGLGRDYSIFVARHQQAATSLAVSSVEAESGTAEAYVVSMSHGLQDPQYGSDKVHQVALGELIQSCNWERDSSPSGCLYCHDTDNVIAFDTDKQDMDVKVLAGAMGGKFLVCSMHDLSEADGNASLPVVKIAVLSVAGKPEIITSRSLPTPPASPPLKAVSFAQVKKDGTVTPRSPTPVKNRRAESPKPTSETKPIVRPKPSSTTVDSQRLSLRDELQYRIRNLFSTHPNSIASTHCTTLSRHWHSHLHLPARIFAAFSLVTWVVRVLLMGMWGVMTFPPVVVGRGASWVCSLGLRLVTGGRIGRGTSSKRSDSGREVEMAEAGERPAIKRPDTPPNVDTDVVDAEPEVLALQGTTTSKTKDAGSSSTIPTTADQVSTAPLTPPTPKLSSSARIRQGKALKWSLPLDASFEKHKHIKLLLSSPGLSGANDEKYDVILSRLYVEVNGRKAERVETKAVERGMTMVSYAPPTPLVQSGFMSDSGGVGGNGAGSLALNSLLVRMD